MTDKFASIAALKLELKESDYRIRCLDRQSWATIIAPHGGYIEPGSSAIAEAIAGEDFNLFDFQGLRVERPWELHVTATRFREPRLSALLKQSSVAVSIHGMGDQGHKQIWLGGLNQDLKLACFEQLVAAGFEVNPSAPRYRGESPDNLVNLAGNAGVQLELSNELLADLFVRRGFYRRRQPVPTGRFEALVDAVRSTLIGYRLKFMHEVGKASA